MLILDTSWTVRRELAAVLVLVYVVRHFLDQTTVQSLCLLEVSSFRSTMIENDNKCEPFVAHCIPQSWQAGLSLRRNWTQTRQLLSIPAVLFWPYDSGVQLGVTPNGKCCTCFCGGELDSSLNFQVSVPVYHTVRFMERGKGEKANYQVLQYNTLERRHQTRGREIPTYRRPWFLVFRTVWWYYSIEGQWHPGYGLSNQRNYGIS